MNDDELGETLSRAPRARHRLRTELREAHCPATMARVSHGRDRAGALRWRQGRPLVRRRAERACQRALGSLAEGVPSPRRPPARASTPAALPLDFPSGEHAHHRRISTPDPTEGLLP